MATLNPKLTQHTQQTKQKPQTQKQHTQQQTQQQHVSQPEKRKISFAEKESNGNANRNNNQNKKPKFKNTKEEEDGPEQKLSINKQFAQQFELQNSKAEEDENGLVFPRIKKNCTCKTINKWNN